MQSRFDTIAAAKGWDGTRIPPNQETLILVNGVWTRWRFVMGSTSVDPFEYTVFAPTTNGAVGKWHYAGNKINFRMPWMFDTPDNTVLFTVPDGFRFMVSHSRIAEITINMASGSFMGLSTSRTSFNPGVIGFGGNPVAGTFVGQDDGDLYEPEKSILLPGDTFLHMQTGGGDYTAGAGYWHVSCFMLQL